MTTKIEIFKYVVTHYNYMFVEIRKRGKNRKYYLAHSFREGKKVVKLMRYLGQNLSESELIEKRKKAEQFIKEHIKQYREIRDPFKTALSKTELEQIKSLESKKLIKIFHLSEKQWLKFSEIFSYNTNAIEGSTITQNEVKGIIEKNNIPNKSKEDIAEAKSVAEAIQFIRKTKEHISMDLIKNLHFMVFKDTKSFAGKFREGIEVVIRDGSGRIIHRGAPSHHIVYLLKELVQWYEQNNKKYPPILLAAVVHNQFENIHPFQDGNGRVGRLLLNSILLKHNMPPVNISFKNRMEYYAALQSYENQGNIRPTIELILKEYKSLKQLKR